MIVHLSKPVVQKRKLVECLNDTISARARCIVRKVQLMVETL